MSEEQMRAALEEVKNYFNASEVSGEDYDKMMERINEALKVEPAENPADIAKQGDNYKQMYEGLLVEIGDLRREMMRQSGAVVRNQLLNLPDQIQEQSLEVAKTTELIEMQRLVLDRKKNDHLNFVLSATENGKPKFSNEQARKAAVESLIAEDVSYAEAYDSLTLKEALLKRQEIELTHLNNLFRAYLAIAGMGAR